MNDMRKFMNIMESAGSRINEAMWVVKSLDGVEKRFKDHSSPEALAWKASTKKKVKVKIEKYSTEWWEAEEDKDPYGIFPWSPITEMDVGDSGIVEKEFGTQNTDFSITRKWSKLVDGVSCAVATVRVMFQYGPEDDMGLEDTVEDAQMISVMRDRKDPKKISMSGFA